MLLPPACAPWLLRGVFLSSGAEAPWVSLATSCLGSLHGSVLCEALPSESREWEPWVPSCSAAPWKGTYEGRSRISVAPEPPCLAGLGAEQVFGVGQEGVREGIRRVRLLRSPRSEHLSMRC